MTRILFVTIFCLVSTMTHGGESLDLNRPDWKNLQNQARLDQQKWENVQTQLKLSQVQSKQNLANLFSGLSSAHLASAYLANHSLLSRFRLSSENLSKYLELLGNPQDRTGVFKFTEDQRLYQYGLICIEVGLVEQGVHAISEYMRLQAEIAAAQR